MRPTLQSLVTSVLLVGCRAEPEDAANGPNPLQALAQHVESSRYGPEYWRRVAEQDSALWRKAMDFCTRENTAEYPTCASVRMVNFLRTNSQPAARPILSPSGPIGCRTLLMRALPTEACGSMSSGNVPRSLRFLVMTLTVLLLATALAAYAAAQQPVLDGIGQQYQAASRLWRPRLIPVAQRLFMVLAGIEFAVSGAIWALRRDSLDDIAAKFLLKFTLVAFLLALITSFTYWIPPIVNGFAAAGEQAIGGLTVSPSGVLDIGRETSLKVLATLDLGVMFKNPAMAIYGALAALIIALAYIAIAAQLVLVLVESYVVLGGGVLFLGFSAFRATAGFAENLVAYTFGVGIKIFLLYLIVGLGTEIARGWIPLIQATTFFGPASPLLQVVGGAVIFAVLAIRVPNAVASRLAGQTSLGIGAALRALG